MTETRTLLILIIFLTYMNASVLGCGTFFQSIETKNQQLRDAEHKILKNPRDEKALSVILNMLKDRDTVARANAAATLGDLGEKCGSGIKDKAIPSLIKALSEDNRFVKNSAACALEKFGPLAIDAIPVLVKNLIPSDSSVAWCCAEALGAIGEGAKEAVPELLRVIKEDQSKYSIDRTSISEFAIKAIGEIGPAAKEAIPDLVSLLSHQSEYFKIFVAIALIRIDPGNEEGLGALKNLLKSPDVNVRRKTIWSLRDIGLEAKVARDVIKEAVKDSDLDVREAASRLLETIGSD